MRLRKERRIFKVHDRGGKNYESEIKGAEIIIVPEQADVVLFDVFFKEKIITRIDILKSNEHIHVQLFMKNKLIASHVEKEHVVVVTEFREDAHGNEYAQSITIQEYEKMI